MGASKRQIGGVKGRTPEQERAKYAKRRRVRTVMLKFRVVPMIRMPRSKMFAEMLASIESGVASRWLRMEYVNYEGKVGASIKPGSTMKKQEQQDLADVYELMVAASEQGGVRFERVR